MCVCSVAELLLLVGLHDLAHLSRGRGLGSLRRVDHVRVLADDGLEVRRVGGERDGEEDRHGEVDGKLEHLQAVPRLGHVVSRAGQPRARDCGVRDAIIGILDSTCSKPDSGESTLEASRTGVQTEYDAGGGIPSGPFHGPRDPHRDGPHGSAGGGVSRQGGVPRRTRGRMRRPRE